MAIVLGDEQAVMRIGGGGEAAITSKAWRLFWSVQRFAEILAMLPKSSSANMATMAGTSAATAWRK